MESKNKLKEVTINRWKVIQKYFGLRHFIQKFDWCKKPLHIRFDKVDGIFRFYDGTRYLVLFGPEKYDSFSIGLNSL